MYINTHNLSKEVKSVTRVQILDEAVCVSLRSNALRKGMNPSVLPTSYE